MNSHKHIFVLQSVTFNPDWQRKSGWARSSWEHTHTHTHIRRSFIIQSAAELSTWINKSLSYLKTQTWVSVPTGSGWRKLSAPLFWFAFASYRDRILFFSPIHPPGFQSPESRFPPVCVIRVCTCVCVPATSSIHDPSLLLIFADRALIFRLLINPLRCRIFLTL